MSVCYWRVLCGLCEDPDDIIGFREGRVGRLRKATGHSGDMTRPVRESRALHSLCALLLSDWNQPFHACFHHFFLDFSAGLRSLGSYPLFLPQGPE